MARELAAPPPFPKAVISLEKTEVRASALDVIVSSAAPWEMVLSSTASTFFIRLCGRSRDSHCNYGCLCD